MNQPRQRGRNPGMGQFAGCQALAFLGDAEANLAVGPLPWRVPGVPPAARTSGGTRDVTRAELPEARRAR